MTIRTGVARVLLLAAAVLTVPACDPSDQEDGDDDRQGRDLIGVPANVVTWGCERRIPSSVETLDPRWREESTVVGDLGFGLKGARDFSAFRPHERADLQVKLPVTIEGHTGATVWVPSSERKRVALILADVPRRGPGSSYRIEDGHQAVRFEPCLGKEWSAWTAGLALADRGEIVLNVMIDGAASPTPVTLGPWRL